jgi:opacity protein-like surface antigen
MDGEARERCLAGTHKERIAEWRSSIPCNLIRGECMKIRVRAGVLVSAVATALAVAAPVYAQDSGDGFRFHAPSGSWSFRGGYAMPSANSDLFTFTTSNLTVNHNDFNAVDIGGDLAFTISPRLDLTFDLSYSGVDKGSESRNFVDNNNQPIEQSTSFSRTPLTVNARYYLMDRGRRIGHYAWVPNSIAPYVGAGVGIMNYAFDQKGDFVDDSTLAVFTDRFHSSGWAPMAQVLAGVEWSLSPGWAVRTEARYLTASAAPSSDFSGFHRIDLSGFTASAGFLVRF